MSEQRKTVIIGGVAGGASCAARLRRLDADREIVILERGAYISYANCGLPYHVGDVIKNRGALLLMTPERMWERFRIDVRVQNEVTEIDREKKTVTVRKTETGEVYEQPYDDLVIAKYDIFGYPSFIIIDSEGKILSKGIGLNNFSEALKKLLPAKDVDKIMDSK